MSDPAAFFAAVLADARTVTARTGVPTSVVLAQMGLETGYGTSPAWLEGHNYAGLSPGGRPARYPDRQTGLAAYIANLLSPNYAAVRAAGTSDAAVAALAESPWDAGHYGGGGALSNIIDRYQLTQLDDPAAAAAGGSSSGANAATVGFPNPLNAAGDVAGKVVELLVGAVKGPVLTGLFVAGGAALVVAGVVHTVKPAIDAKMDQAGELAKVAMVAA